MFCPQCATENHSEKNYCRQCGQPLEAVRLAVDGRVDEVIKTVSGDTRLGGYRLQIGMACFFILVSAATIFSGGIIGFSNVQSAALILIMMMIFYILLSRRVHRVARLLDAEDESWTSNISGSNTTIHGQLREKAGDSITEQTTLELKADHKMHK